MNVTFYTKILIKRDKSIDECQLKWIHFLVYEFEVGVDESIFSGNEQQKL